MGVGVIGATGYNRTVLSNAQVYRAMATDAQSSLDATAVGSLQKLTTGGIPQLGESYISALVNGFNSSRTGYVDTRTRFDNDGSANNAGLVVSSANAKALGIFSDANGNALDYDAVDGEIAFNSDLDFDFDPSDGVDSAGFDFIGVAIHEIGHSLGFTSGVDYYDASTGYYGDQRPGGLERGVVMSPLDYFRYSAPGVLDWSTQNTPYLSADGGKTQLFGNSLMSTGVRYGDGRQASHWKDSAAGIPQLGIMDPTAGRGQSLEVTARDLAAFDMIGWNVAFDPLTQPGYRIGTGDIYTKSLAGAVPEPATWAMMICGFGLVGGAMRRRTSVSLA